MPKFVYKNCIILFNLLYGVAPLATAVVLGYRAVGSLSTSGAARKNIKRWGGGGGEGRK